MCLVIIRRDAIFTPAAFGAAAGMAILWWMAYAQARVLSPLQRRRTLLLEWRGGVYGIMLAVLTAWLLPGQAELAGWLAANAWWVAGLCVVTPIIITTAASTVVPLRLIPVGLLRYLVDRGTLAFYLAMLTASEDLAAFAAWIVGYNLLTELLALRPGHDWTPRMLDAHRYFDAPPVIRRRIVDQWLEEAVRRPARRGKEPDLSFVYSLCAQVSPALRAYQDAGLAAVHVAPPRVGNDPMAWHDRALHLVELAEAEIPEPGERQRRGLSLARARCAQVRGEIHHIRSGHLDEALECYEEVADRWRASGLHNVYAEFLSVLALGAMRSPLITTPVPPEKVLPRLLALLDEPALVPLTRRWVLLSAAVCHLTLRRHDEAVALREAARLLGSRLTGRRRLTAERRAAGLIAQARSDDRQWDAVMLTSWYGADGVLRLSRTTGDDADPVPVIDLSTWGHGRSAGKVRTAMQSWVGGEHETAGALLEETADALEADRLPGQAARVLIQLGMAQRAVDPPRAYRNLRRAMELRESLRGELLGADLRMLFGGGSEDLHIELVRLLHEADFFPGESWPAHPARVAFEIVERTRARSMLELLGTALEPPDAPAYAGPAAEERELLIELSQARESGDTARTRSVRARLDDVWRRMAAAGPEGAEYAQLRRGEPAGYDDIRRLLSPASDNEVTTPPGTVRV